MVDRTHGETKLWESFIKGETAAFEEVYRRYYSLSLIPQHYYKIFFLST